MRLTECIALRVATWERTLRRRICSCGYVSGRGFHGRRCQRRSQGPGQHAYRQGRVRAPLPPPFPRSRLRCRGAGDRAPDRPRLGGIRRLPQGAAHPQGRAGLCRSRLRAVAGLDRRARRASQPRSSASAIPRRALRILGICGSPRSDETCPGEMSKTFRLIQLAREIVRGRRASSSTCSTSAASPRNTDASSTPARAAFPPPCRSATGPAPAIPITRSARSMTG